MAGEFDGDELRVWRRLGDDSGDSGASELLIYCRSVKTTAWKLLDKLSGALAHGGCVFYGEVLRWSFGRRGKRPREEGEEAVEGGNGSGGELGVSRRV